MSLIPHSNPGVAGFASDAFENTQLLAGDTPAMVTKAYPVDAAISLPIYSVVGFDAQGEVTPAVHGTTQAVGITLADTGAAAAGRSVPVLRAGRIFANWLNWPASYDTAAKKLAAFNGAPTPTNIYMENHPEGPAL